MACITELGWIRIIRVICYLRYIRKGNKWGWRLGSFYYICSVVGNTSTLITMPILIRSMSVEEMRAMSHGVPYFYAECGGYAIVHFLLYLYFFKGNVRAYFSISEQKKCRLILIQTVICLGIAAVVSAIARIVGADWPIIFDPKGIGSGL